MSYRQSNSSSKDAYIVPQSRLNQHRRDSTDEGCPVIEESGTVCGETNSLSIFQEFRQMYDDCLKKLEGTVNGNATLKKLAPFKKLIDDLWEQNTMLVETVEELEQEATYRVTNLQDRLNKSCQKIGDYKDDIKSLVKIIHCFCENGVFDLTGLKFKTFSCSSVFGDGRNNSLVDGGEERDLMRCDISFKRASGSLRSDCERMFKAQEDEIGVESDLYDSNQPPRTFPSRGGLSNKIKNTKSKQSSTKFGHTSRQENSVQNISSVRSLNQSGKFESDSVENCPDYIPPININFNFGNNETCDNPECCCGCNCLNNEIEDF